MGSTYLKCSAFSVIAAVFLIPVDVAWAEPAGSSYLSSPMYPDRRALDAVHRDYIEVNSPDATANLVISRWARHGIRNNLSADDFSYYMNSNVAPDVLFGLLEEIGITRKENDALTAMGVDFRKTADHGLSAYHWVAVSDTVVMGTVSDVVGNPEGPYHTTVVLRVENRIKTCFAQDRTAENIQANILQSGPRRVGDAIQEFHFPSEPRIKAGERVVLLMGRNPIHLQTELSNRANNPSFASPNNLLALEGRTELLNLAAVGRPENVEIYKAYKVVGSRLVLKDHSDRPRSPENDILDRDRFISLSKDIADIQQPYCNARALALEGHR